MHEARGALHVCRDENSYLQMKSRKLRNLKGGFEVGGGGGGGGGFSP